MPPPYVPDGRVYLRRGFGDFHVKFGFGYDHVNDDYKLVRIVQSDNREVIVYNLNLNLNLNEWKMVEDVDSPKDTLLVYQSSGVLMYDCLLHWVFRGNDNGVYRVYCFDVRSDKWTDNVPLMDLLNEEDGDKVFDVCDMAVLIGCLCLTMSTNLSRFVWIMKEYGVKESWVKLFDVSRSFGTGPCYFIHSPLGFRQGRKLEVLVHKEDGCGLFWCDIDNESGSYGRIEDIQYVLDFGDFCFFKESLVTVPGGEKIIAFVPSDDHEEIIMDLFKDLEDF